MNLPFQNQDHAVGRGAFFEKYVPGLGHYLFAVSCQPQPVLKRKTVQWADAFNRFRDLFDGGGTGGGRNAGGKHPGPPGCKYRISDSEPEFCRDD